MTNTATIANESNCYLLYSRCCPAPHLATQTYFPSQWGRYSYYAHFTDVDTGELSPSDNARTAFSHADHDWGKEVTPPLGAPTGPSPCHPRCSPCLLCSLKQVLALPGVWISRLHPMLVHLLHRSSLEGTRIQAADRQNPTHLWLPSNLLSLESAPA